MWGQTGRLRVFMAAGMALVSGLVLAADLAQADGHDRARQLMDAGEIVPLGEIVGRINEQRDGRILEVELDQQDGDYIYEVELLNAKGQVRELKYDARSGELIGDEKDE